MVTASMMGTSISSAVFVPTKDDPQCADSSKHEARSEHEWEIKYTQVRDYVDEIMCRLQSDPTQIPSV